MLRNVEVLYQHFARGNTARHLVNIDVDEDAVQMLISVPIQVDRQIPQYGTERQYHNYTS